MSEFCGRPTLEIIRKGKKQDISVIIGSLGNSPVIAQTSTLSTDFGVSVQTITADLAEQFGTSANEGVVVTSVKKGSVAQKMGIKVGEVILQVGQTSIGSAAEFKSEVSKLKGKKQILLLIKSGGNQRFIAFTR